MDQIISNISSNAFPLQLGLTALGVATLSWIVLRKFTASKSPGRYPPGPPQLPIVGNAFNFPLDGWSITFNEWAVKYGDLVYVQLPGMPFFIVNSLDMAHELLSKRIQVNSDRKVGYMVKYLMGWSWSPAFRDADEVHRKQRLMFRRGIGPTRIPTHDHLIEKGSRNLILDLQSIEGDPIQWITKAVGTAIIELSYGEIMMKNHGQGLIKLNVDAMHMLEAAFHTVWLVDFFPVLRFLPSWLVSFRRYATHSTTLVNRVRSWPFQEAHELFKAGKLDHSLIRDLFEEFGPSVDVQDSTANLYFAGVDTTTSVAVSFLLILFVFPEIAKNVQAEIDSVTGQERLPTVKDRAKLPYTEAVWKESLRWHPNVPNGIPHCSTEDQTINGYFIPKGSLINPNIGYMLIDPRIWGDPEAFRPERHLPSPDSNSPSLPNPAVLVFGFGARTCPGMYFADRVGFHLILSLISLFDVLPLAGKDLPKPTDFEYTKSVILYPKNLECCFVTRNEKASALLSAMNIGASEQ